MKVIEIEDKVQFFSDDSDEKDCAFLFVSNRFPGTSIAPLRFAAGSLLLVFP